MIAKLSRLAPKALRIRWWQTPAKLARIDCTGFTCAVEETNLPYVPEIAVVNAIRGEFDILPPGAVDLAEVERAKSYSVSIVLRNAGGAPVDDFRLTVMFE